MARRAMTTVAAISTALSVVLCLVGVNAAAADASPSSPVATDTASTTTPPPPPSGSSSTTPPSSPASTTTTRPSTSPKPTVTSTTSRPRSTSSPSPSTPAPTGGTHEQSLSATQLAAQVGAAEALRAELAKVNVDLAGVVTQLDALSKRANAELERYADATAAQATARAEATRNQDLSDRLAIEVAAEKQRLRAWAYYAYTEGGGSVAEMMGVLDSMKESPAHVGNPVGDLVYLTDSRGQLFATITGLSQKQAVATQRAQAASAAAKTAADKAATAKAAAAGLVADQQARLAALRKTHAADIEKAGPLVQVLAGVLDPAAKKAYAALLAEMSKAGVSLSQVGTPCSNDNGTYANGELPPSALCPLWQASGESLRPKAAAGFNAMSAAYAKDTGSPLCVTDSYRSLSEQVSVKASRGRWAATPGTSKHGLGIAVDLCGGVNSFGTAAYEWMQQNAPMYGWYHPSWADPGGSLPEPWHWQYAG